MKRRFWYGEKEQKRSIAKEHDEEAWSKNQAKEHDDPMLAKSQTRQFNFRFASSNRWIDSLKCNILIALYSLDCALLICDLSYNLSFSSL